MALDNNYERMNLEKYYTPQWVTDVLLNNESFTSFDDSSGKPRIVKNVIWEPAAGNGAIGKRLLEAGYSVIFSDISPDENFVEEADFLSTTTSVPYSVNADIVTNPPYGTKGELAEKFIVKALEKTLASERKVAMLLKADYDSASSREYLFKDHPAFSKKIVLTKRIRWDNLEQKENSPRFNHAWYVWDWRKAFDREPIIKYGR